ncbi:MAG: hypothetical protein ACSHXI_17880 [Hoeflea sp.]|uniref:hypothetical protein n=1 Tax=Hoeflea sp. TaxID=1940281 RepID=UPI003EF09B9E
MKLLWPGWLLCVLTAGLFTWIYLIEVPAVTVLIDGFKLPDQMLLGHDEEGARALFAAFKADYASSQAAGRASASEAYVALHAGFDLVLPPLLAGSIGFCAFAALFRPAQSSQIPPVVGVGSGLTLALAFTYLASDFIENSVADAMFGPNALNLAFNESFVFVLQVLTRSKFASLALAFSLISALWVWRWKSPRSSGDRTRPQ